MPLTSVAMAPYGTLAFLSGFPGTIAKDVGFGGTVKIQFNGGAPLALSGVPITLRIISGPGVLSGSTTLLTDAAGQVVFSGLSLNTAGDVVIQTVGPGFKPVSSSITVTGLKTYSTTFPLTENPISESGLWVNGKTTGVQWSDVRTTPGKAFGTQLGTNGLDDSWAHLGDTWAANQEVTATIINGGSGSTPGEVELTLHALITPNNARGYECLFSLGGLAEIVRWNGAFGAFTPLTSVSQSYVTGDIVKARWLNGVITMYKNNVAFLSYSGPEASTWATGNPGMGFFRRDTGPQNVDFGISTWAAAEI